MGIGSLQRIRGIVLQPIKYSDSSIILRLFTRELGGLSVMVKGVRKKGSGKSNIYFQPLNILDLELYVKKDIRGVHLLKECNPYFIPATIGNKVEKSCVAIFLCEVLTSLLHDGDSNPSLFSFIETGVRFFDNTTSNYANFHISFIAKLCGFMGIEPNPPADKEFYFDMINGKFSHLPPPHNDYAEQEESKLLAALFFSSLQNSGEIRLSGSMRNKLLELMLKYISIHIPMLRQIKSLEVMRELFRG